MSRRTRLDQLEEVNLFDTDISAAHMSALARLPGITRIGYEHMQLDAIPMLPRLPRLQRLAIDLPQLANNSDAERETLYSSLRACFAFTAVDVDGDEWSEAVGEWLLRVLPRLRKLSIADDSLPSLRFLRHAPELTDLDISQCKHLRVGHILALGSLVPRLEHLAIFDIDGLLDELERQALTPPGALGLPSLLSFMYEVEPPR